jgi:hypothetical protein
MSNYGIKIAKQNKDVGSQDIDDYVFWSKHPSLSVIGRDSTTIVIDDDNYGTGLLKELPHSFGFIPFTLAYIKSDLSANRVLLPTVNNEDLFCTPGLLSEMAFELKIYSDKVSILYSGACVLMGSEDPPLAPATFIIDVEYYLWELGRELN